ncbi:MAG: site-specific integrase [Tissierellia bacterium]|nr:site-specific integrase [Tissierellia bacterium]
MIAVTKWEDDLISEKRYNEEKEEDIKLDRFVEFWRKEIAPMTLRHSTQVTYNDLIDRIILPNLGHIYLSKITPTMVQKMINEQAEKGLSKRTVKYPLQVLSSIFSHAIRLGKIRDNPCARVVLPNTEQQKKIELENKKLPKLFNKEDLRIMINAVKDEQLKYQTIFFLALSGGLRRGEILGLKIDDVKDKGVMINEAKNISSERFVTLDDATMKLLRLQKAEIVKISSSLEHNEGWLFIQANGRKMGKGTPRQWLIRLIKQINKKGHDIPVLPIHALRHTNATIMVASGIDIKTASQRLGHSNTTMTMEIYAHMLKEKEESAASALDDYLHEL